MIESIKDFNGKFVWGKHKVLDGVEYEYGTIWDDGEEADAFLETLAVSKTGRDYIDKVLTVFFSVKADE